MQSSEAFSRRSFIALGAASAVSGIVPTATPAAALPLQDAPRSRSTSRPNLILFMPDELRADALACYGNPITRTPNFDSMAKQGVRFSNCHVQFPVCGASRCSLLTGWPTSVRGHRSLFYFLRPDEPNMFRSLRQAGYDVFWFGKNDALAAETFYDSVTRWGIGDEGQSKPPANSPRVTGGPLTFIEGSTGDRRRTNDYVLLQAAIKILERKESDRPFCIFLPLTSPHPPYSAPDGFQEMYKASDMTGLRPINLKKRPSYVDGMRQEYGLSSLPESTFRQVRALYYSGVSYADWLLGELLAALDKTNHAKDTSLFLLSDHGDYAGDYGLVEKWPSGLEDCLTHVPLMVRSPGAVAGHTAENMVELYDVMATCIDLAQTKTQHTHFARSLMPQMQGSSGDPQRAAFAEGGYNLYEPQCFEDSHGPGTRYYPKSHLQLVQPETVSRASMIRTSTHKLISRPQGQSELYSYADDPNELNNLFGDSSVRPVQDELIAGLLHRYINTTGIAPPDKDPRECPPFYPTPHLWTEDQARTILDKL